MLKAEGELSNCIFVYWPWGPNYIILIIFFLMENYTFAMYNKDLCVVLQLFAQWVRETLIYQNQWQRTFAGAPIIIANAARETRARSSGRETSLLEYILYYCKATHLYILFKVPLINFVLWPTRWVSNLPNCLSRAAYNIYLRRPFLNWVIRHIIR